MFIFVFIVTSTGAVKWVVLIVTSTGAVKWVVFIVTSTGAVKWVVLIGLDSICSAEDLHGLNLNAKVPSVRGDCVHATVNCICRLKWE